MSTKEWPLAWSYHRNTERWPHNIRALDDTTSPVATFCERLECPRIALPSPVELEISLGAAIRARCSCRQFANASLELAHVSTLLATGYGVHQRTMLDDGRELLERPVPSGGGLYPLEIYVLVRKVNQLDPGIYHYLPLYHQLEQIERIQLPGSLFGELFLGQAYLGSASMIVCIVAMLSRSLWKYSDRGYRYVLMEAGHVGQNLNLASAGLGLGSLDLGGFLDRPLARLLHCSDELEFPLYGVAFGVPATLDRASMRQATGVEVR